MEVPGSERKSAWTPLFFSLVLIVGMVLGFNLRESLRAKRDIATVIERNDRLEQVIDLINEKYVDTINSNNLYQDAITGILKSLDPHTVYIPAEQMEDVTENLEGGFSGVGVEFSIIRDTIQVTSVIENGPAQKAGVETGDQLIKVGDSIVAGVNITADRISHLLRGKQKSQVGVTLRNPFASVLRNLSITRDIIPLYSVEAGIMLDNTTGFIKVNRFSATTYKEVKDALTRLTAEGATQLILDLRDNPGGYLSQATAVADEFIDENKLLLFTKGTHAAKVEYKAESKGIFEKGRLVVLIDEGSASASEIVAGAIQDWDRGVIAGRRSYGKGLVQEPYEMGDGSELRLTIAKYYTPSGRCIQRSFAGGRDAYQSDYEKRFETGELTGNDTTTIPADTTKYYTANRRLVYGGGGIKPDVYVPYDTLHISAAATAHATSTMLKTIVWDFFLKNKSKLAYKNIRDYVNNFSGEEVVLKEYLAALNAAERKKILAEMLKPATKQYFYTYIKSQIGRYLFHDNGFYTVSVKQDVLVSRALDILNSNEYSRIISRK